MSTATTYSPDDRMTLAEHGAAHTANFAERNAWYDPPCRPRRRSAPRRKPGHATEHVFYGGGNYLRAQRVKHGSILLPDPADGWSALSIRLIERACEWVLELEGIYPVREYGGPVPDLFRNDILTAAADEIDDDITGAEMLAAVAEAWRYLGFN